jgi:hypothetical protein
VSTDIEWGPPPAISAGGARNTKAIGFVEALRGRPGEWARYPHSMKSGTSTSTYRRNFPGTKWTARKRSDGRYDMYGCWIGADA